MTPPDLQWFVDVGAVSEVVRIIKSGKESQVYLTRRFCGDRIFYFATKVHKPRIQRSFKRDKVYRVGWYFKDGRVQRAVSKTSRYGRNVIGARWVNREFDALKKLWKNGANVPTPILKHRNTILMTYIGHPEEPAPKLREISLDQDEAAEALKQVVENIKIFLKSGLVHADLSPFNILYWQDKVWIIDLPQAVDLHKNPYAMDLLHRDLQKICKYFEKQGVNCAPEELFRQVLGLAYVPGKTYQDLLTHSAESDPALQYASSKHGKRD